MFSGSSFTLVEYWKIIISLRVWVKIQEQELPALKQLVEEQSGEVKMVRAAVENG